MADKNNTVSLRCQEKKKKKNGVDSGRDNILNQSQQLAI